MLDVVVVGAGPAGLSAALCLARVGRQVLVLDGGSWRNVSSDTIHNLLSRDGFSPADLRAAALMQLKLYSCAKVQAGAVDSVSGESGDFHVQLADGRIAHARRLLLATGVEDVLPDIPGLPERWGQSVVHCRYCHGWERAGLTLGVLALNDKAVLEAIHVRRLSEDVTLYTNGDFTLTTHQRGLLEAQGVFVREEPIVRLDGPRSSLEHLVLTDGRTAACQALFCRAPTRQRSRLAAALGCHLFDDDAVEVNELAQTTQPGIYAVGDMARTAATPSVVHQVVRAAAQGVAAATVIDQELLLADSLG